MYGTKDCRVAAANREVLRGLVPMIENLPADDGSEPEGTSRSYLLSFAEMALSRDDLPADKIGRWVGYIHGILAARGVLSVKAERDRTRPIFRAAYAEAGISIPPTVEVEARR